MEIDYLKASLTHLAARQRNVILMISDGFGPASETYARQYHMWREQLPPSFMLPLDHIHVGQSRTQSSSSLITDSAAGATGEHISESNIPMLH